MKKSTKKKASKKVSLKKKVAKKTAKRKTKNPDSFLKELEKLVGEKVIVKSRSFTILSTGFLSKNKIYPDHFSVSETRNGETDLIFGSHDVASIEDVTKYKRLEYTPKQFVIKLN